MKGYLSDIDYNFIYERVPRFCVDLVIKKGKNIFLVKRDIQPYRGKYHLPGGRVRFRESIEHTANRIAKTEAGISIEIKKLLGFMEFPIGGSGWQEKALNKHSFRGDIKG